MQGMKNLKMHTYFAGGGGLITHTDKKDTKNCSDDQKQTIILAYLFLLVNVRLYHFHEPLLPIKV